MYAERIAFARRNDTKCRGRNACVAQRTYAAHYTGMASLLAMVDAMPVVNILWSIDAYADIDSILT